MAGLNQIYWVFSRVKKGGKYYNNGTIYETEEKALHAIISRLSMIRKKDIIEVDI